MMNRSAPSASASSAASRLRLVVGVVASRRAVDVDDLDVGEHAEPADEVDRGAEAGVEPVDVAKLGICGWKPWPHSQTWLAVEAEAADDLPATRPSARRSSRRGRARSGSTAGLSDEVVRRRALGVGPVGRAPP